MIPIIFSYGGQFLTIPTQLTIAPIQSQVQFLPFSPQMMGLANMSTFHTTNNFHPENFRKSIQSHKAVSQNKPSSHSKSSLLKNEEKETKRVQNPYRNIYTNIINLVLNFIVCRNKVGDLLEEIDSQLVGDRLLNFHKYVKDLKSYFCSYFNVQKVKKLLKGKEIPFFNTDFHRVLRIATKYILEQKIPACLMTSKKLSPALREEHLRARRVIVLILKGTNYSKPQH